MNYTVAVLCCCFLFGLVATLDVHANCATEKLEPETCYKIPHLGKLLKKLEKKARFVYR